MKKGGITIFCILSMMLTASVLCTFIEAARFQEIKYISKLQTELAAETMFANYNNALWEKYHLLGCGYEDAEDCLKEAVNGREGVEQKSLNLLYADAYTEEIVGYTRITDGNGTAYMKAISSYMKENMIYETAKGLYSQYESLKTMKDGGKWNLENMEHALQDFDALQQAIIDQEKEKEIETNEKNKEETMNQTVVYTGVNPLREASNLKNIGILELVLGDKSQVSFHEISGMDMVSKRKLLKGQNSDIESIEWMDEVFLQQYLLKHLKCFLEYTEQEGLCYELEYVIGGKLSDVENLKIVVKELLGIREILNFLYLTSDIQKSEEASRLAIAMVGASANPIFIETVRIGLLTAWAFGESIVDVRSLLQGKRIPLLKNTNSWNLQLTEIGSILQNRTIGKETEDGLTYKEYLGILLMFHSKKECAMRSMDIQEMQIRSMEGKEDFRMDDLLLNVEIEVGYRYKPVFFSFSILERKEWGNKEIWTEARYGYDGSR